MALGTIGTGVSIQTYLKFVECCSGTQILFSGSLAVTNGSVYLYVGTVPFTGSGGSLQPGRCYTITTLTASGVITYPAVPPIALISLTTGCGAEACFNCNPANPCDCPEGYEIIDGFCVGIETVDPIPPKTIVFTGNIVDGGGGLGLLTFQSLNNFVWPLFTTPQLLGDIAAMTIIPNTGNNPVTGDSWTALNPLPQTGINAGKHQPITTATPGGFPALPSPPNPPASPPLRPLRESTITGTTLNYGGGNPIGYDNYEPNIAPWNTWYTNVAVWSLPGLSVINQYAGFLVCLEPTVETVYQVIMTGNNGVRLFVDDYLAVEMLNGDGNFQALAYNNHFQITLSPGLHILRLECYNYTGGGGLAAEVLECSAATVYGFTSLADFIPYRKFSTLWKKSRNLQITATGSNVITLTSGTTLSTDISGFIVQTSGTGFPANTFVTSVINSTTFTVNNNVPNGVYNSCRIQFPYDVSSIANNSFSCPEGFTLTTCEGIACVRTIELPCSSNCYLVMPCNSEDSFVSNSFDLEEFVDSFVTVETEDFYGCAYIVKLDENDCKDAIEVTVYPDEVCDCELRCFYVSNSNGFLYVDANDVLQEVSSIQAKPYLKVCSKVYPVVQNDSQNYDIINFGNCVNNTCPEQCFKLTNCANPETVLYSNTGSLIGHAVNNNILTLNGEEGCWEVSLSSDNCECIKVTYQLVGKEPVTVEVESGGIANSKPYYLLIIGDGYYTIAWADTSVWRVRQPDLPFQATYSEDTPCPFGTYTIEPGSIFEAFEVSECSTACECPIPVTVLQSYPTCEQCLPIVNYKFTNCNNQSIIRYSTEDYSEYVGKTVELECGECWFVSEIDYIPPSTQSIVILYTFDNCIACNRTYYKLTDCLDPTNVTYTYTDLSSIILPPVEGCDCINVSFTYDGVDYEYEVPKIGIDGSGYNDYAYYENSVSINISFNSGDGYWSLLFENSIGQLFFTNYTDVNCPVFSDWTVSFGDFEVKNFVTTSCFCDCIKVTYQLEGEDPVTVEVDSSGVRDGRPTYTGYVEGIPYTLDWKDGEWSVRGYFILESDGLCPFGVYTVVSSGIDIFEAFEVEPCSSLPVIKIKGCDTCFTVEETRLPINAGIVTVTNSYLDCPECLETFPCVCNRITNQGTTAKDFTYLDCLFEEVTINLQPNETSDKVCLINWVLTPEEEALVYIEHFGDCINGQCPVVPLPKRKVKPGYSVPTCDIEKYEKITCRSSEILYKQVMRLRYGISNCCPEDDEKWLIKKELIDLDALRDPDYICKPVTSCCNQPINDCGCNTLKTCNS